MILKTMLLSGVVAGLAGMGPLLTDFHKYGDTFPTAIGFTGIAVALLGRNSPVGIAVAAFVWAGIERASQNLQHRRACPRRSASILQGTLLLTAVIAFEVVRRYRLRLMVKEAAAQTAAERPAPARRRRAAADRSGVMTDLQPRARQRPSATPSASTAGSARACRRAPGARCYALGGFALFSLVRVLADAPALTVGRHVHRHRRPRLADPARRPRRPVLRALGHREHRPRRA